MVNITDYKDPKIVEDKLEAIFRRQKELMKKYHVIEAASGLMQIGTVPIDLDDSRGQARIKDFAWRCTEELMEAMDAYQHKTHFQEEIADALHFLVELAILADLRPKDLVANLVSNHTSDKLDILYENAATPRYKKFLSDTILLFLVSLGMTCHTLKNKPWVQTQRITDKDEFRKRLYFAFRRFVEICIAAEIDAESLYNLYFKKSDVNKFRQRSKY